ncbi:MAG: DUF1232 domain-containing protein [Burkholderiales bacterium]|nr:DUF1232 domain-containing protein [Burkholderiales bacterium]
MTYLATLRAWAQRIKRDGATLWFACKDDRTPWYAKALGVFVVAYALSPIDLIPDFIPVLGYLDEVILLPALIWLAVRMIPGPVLAESRAKADEWMKTTGSRPRSMAGAIAIVALWIVLASVLSLWVAKALAR